MIQPKAVKKPDAKLPEWKPGGGGAVSPLQRLLDSKGLQAKLTIGQPNDRYEQEADRVAADVVQRINSPVTETPQPETVQRETEEGNDELQMKPIYRSSELSHRSGCNCPNCLGMSATSPSLSTIINRKNENKIINRRAKKKIGNVNLANSLMIPSQLSEDMTKEEFIEKLTKNENLRKKINHRPSTGLGRFDAEYNPADGRLIITIKTFFEFGDGVDGNFVRGAGDWEDNEQATFIQNFRDQAQSTWSERFTLNCTKVGFEDITATPIIRFQTVDNYEDAHFNHKITKNNPVMSTGIGREQNDDPDRLRNVGNFILSDAVVGSQKASICRSIAGHDQNRILNLIRAYNVGEDSPLRFQNNGITTLNKDSQRRLTQFAQRLVATSRMGSVPVPIKVIGFDSKQERTFNHKNTAQARAQTIADFLTPLLQAVPNNRPNPIQTETFNTGDVNTAKKRWKRSQERGKSWVHEDRAEYEKLDNLSNHRHAYLTIDIGYQWQGDAYSTLAHEFGHMLGNSDEYFEFGSEAIRDQTVRHLEEKGNPEDVIRAAQIATAGTRNVENTANTQQATFDLAEKAGVDLPEFQSKNSSIMSAGSDLLPMHYLPLWEVLGKITEPAIKPNEWRIG